MSNPSASASAVGEPIERTFAEGPTDDAAVCDDDGFIDLNDPANLVIDDDNDCNDGDNNDDDDNDEEEEHQGEQLLDDNGEPLAQGANLNEEGDHVPPVDDAVAVFYDPESVEKIINDEDEEGRPYDESVPESQRWSYRRVKPLHTVAAHPTDPSLVAVAGESECVYLLNIPSGETLKEMAAAKAASRPAADVKDAAHKGPAALFPFGVDPTSLIGCRGAPLKGHTDTITTMAFSPSTAAGSVLLATGSIDTTVKVWDVVSGECLHTLADLSGEVECLLWHPTGLALLAGAQDAQTIMWNTRKGQAAMYYCGHRGTVTGLLWAADYKKVLTCSADGSVMLFNAKTSEVEMAITKGLSDDQAGVVSMALLPVEGAAANGLTTGEQLTANSDILVVGTEDGTMYVINLKTKKVVQKLAEVHTQAVEAVVACTDPSYVTICPFFVSVSCDCTVAVWNNRDFTCRSRVNIGEGILTARWLRESVLVGGSDGVIRYFDTRTFLEPQIFDVPFQKEKRFGDGTITMANVGEPSNDIKAVDEDAEDSFETFGNKGTRALFGHCRMVFKMVLNNTSDALVSVSDDGTARVFGV